MVVALSVMVILFQSVSGLWDRRNDPSVAGSLAVYVSIRLRSVGPEKFRAACLPSAPPLFQSVSGLWDRRNTAAWASPCMPACFNPSPVCGTGEIVLRRAHGPARSRFNPSPVCGTGEMKLSIAAVCGDWFQSVSGLWDRRNLRALADACLVSVSIRLRSVGPEKCVDYAIAVVNRKFQSVSGLWDRRNHAPRRVVVRDHVSIRLRSVGPEKLILAVVLAGKWVFQSVSGLWDRRNLGRCGP